MLYARAALACLALLFLSSLSLPNASAQDSLVLIERSRVANADGTYRVITRPVSWGPKQTALIVCDMWDTHHCFNAVRRVEELAPHMNRVLAKARTRGVLIIHAPSTCMEPYQNHPARKRSQRATRAANLPNKIADWCHSIPAEEKATYPIDQSDGGCDSNPDEQRVFAAKLKAMGRNPDAPWKSQTDLLTIQDEDVISDSGVEIWNLLEERGIKNVILLGVHTNMCVLGRPFGLRQMAKNGKNVVLMRDMTDTMYNPARWPYVSHFQGTDLVIEHIEKFVCPTITSDQLVGGKPFKFKGDIRPRVVIAIAESEYGTAKTLPVLAKNLLEDRLGLQTIILHGSPANHSVPGLAQSLANADLLIVSMRRVALPEADMRALKEYLDAGKPLIGIRTASHAFDAKGKHPVGHVEWPNFDAVILGGNYHLHHPAGANVTIQQLPAAKNHPIIAGIATPFISHGSLYLTQPLAPTAIPLLIGSIPGRDPEPVAWAHAYRRARIFYTSLGHRDDFKSPSFVKLIENAVRWTLDMRPSGPDNLAVPYSKAVSDQIEARRALTALLKTVRDESSMIAARQNLPKLSDRFNEVIRWAIILPYPPVGANEGVRREFGADLSAITADMQAEMERIQKLEGGQSFLNELAAVPWLQEPVTPWRVVDPEHRPRQSSR